MKHAVSAILVLGLMSHSSPSYAQREDRREVAYRALTQDEFARSITMNDDPLNPDIRIDTRQGYRDYQFSFGPREDQFLRASILRTSGEIISQAYVTAEANTSAALQPTTASFEHTLSARPVTRVALDVRACGRSGCIYYEEMVFELPPDDIEALIGAMVERGDAFVRFRIHGQSGRQRDGRFHVSELRAFLAALEPYVLQPTPAPTSGD